jgi:hypothetical protein
MCQFFRANIRKQSFSDIYILIYKFIASVKSGLIGYNNDEKGAVALAKIFVSTAPIF